MREDESYGEDGFSVRVKVKFGSTIRHGLANCRISHEVTDRFHKTEKAFSHPTSDGSAGGCNGDSKNVGNSNANENDNAMVTMLVWR